MRRTIAVLFLSLAACGGSESPLSELSRSPVSARGWILDVKGAQRGETMEMELARRSQLFVSSSVWVEETQYASGGIAENGAFVVLDVPPQKATIGFNAPGAETAKIVLQDVPGNADVFLPDVILENGGATFLDPSKVIVRIASTKVDKPTPTGRYATIAGIRAPIIETPIGQMNDRRDYPSPPGFRPVATVK
ncbi:MAG TPA: hypothetical protein VFO89_04845 [Thermoanaerobaculia bacterium]|nr:hypothetical protein [Thermoanaerobaculia bacterium]